MMFVYAFGADKAKKMLGGFSAYTPTVANYFKNMNRYYSEPVPGDVIFFKNKTRIYHTGIVYAVDNALGVVRTIEGNTSSVSGVVENGGCVAMKSYSLNYNKIAGYGRSKYELIETEELDMTQYEELKAEIEVLRSAVDMLTGKMIYNYQDANMPEWARLTVRKMFDKGILKGNENGELGLTDEMLRMFVMNDRAGLYDKAEV